MYKSLDKITLRNEIRKAIRVAIRRIHDKYSYFEYNKNTNIEKYDSTNTAFMEIIKARILESEYNGAMKATTVLNSLLDNEYKKIL